MYDVSMLLISACTAGIKITISSVRYKEMPCGQKMALTAGDMKARGHRTTRKKKVNDNQHDCNCSYRLKNNATPTHKTQRNSVTAAVSSW